MITVVIEVLSIINSFADNLKDIVMYTFILDVYEILLKMQADSRSDFENKMKGQRSRKIIVYLTFFLADGSIFVLHVLRYSALISSADNLVTMDYVEIFLKIFTFSLVMYISLIFFRILYFYSKNTKTNNSLIFAVSLGILSVTVGLISFSRPIIRLVFKGDIIAEATKLTYILGQINDLLVSLSFLYMGFKIGMKK